MFNHQPLDWIRKFDSGGLVEICPKFCLINGITTVMNQGTVPGGCLQYNAMGNNRITVQDNVTKWDNFPLSYATGIIIIIVVE